VESSQVGTLLDPLFLPETLKRLAENLLERESLDADEVHAIVNGKKQGAYQLSLIC